MSYLTDLEDDREELARINARPTWEVVTATDKQLNLIRILLRQNKLFKSDFTEEEYYNKKSMHISRASELIKIGLARQEELRVERIISRMG